MYHTILVPLDGSTRAEAILPHVEDIAKCSDGTVILLRVVEPFSRAVTSDGISPILDGPLFEQEVNDARAYLAGVLASLQQKGIRAEMRLVSNGPIAGRIIEVAKEVGADLIAMASHGRTGLGRVIYGSVALGVLQSTDRPLLLVRSING